MFLNRTFRRTIDNSTAKSVILPIRDKKQGSIFWILESKRNQSMEAPGVKTGHRYENSEISNHKGYFPPIILWNWNT